MPRIYVNEMDKDALQDATDFIQNALDGANEDVKAKYQLTIDRLDDMWKRAGKNR